MEPDSNSFQGDVSMKRKPTVKRVLNILSTVLLIAVILLVIVIFITRITGHVPSIFGYTIFRVQTESMTPTLEVGDVIVDKKVPAEEIKKGDIITYDCISGELKGQTITHRVVTDPQSRNGTYYYQTQGDRPGAELDDIVSYDQVEGKFIQKITWMNKIYTFFLSPYGLITFILIIMVLFGYEMISLLISYHSLDEKDDDYYEPKPKKKSKKRK
ncbi:MAG TPA: signal peptidase I [Ruminococcaceae bacterium]|nr:signal peptidase I [Oscillospiraceae bacterium]